MKRICLRCQREYAADGVNYCFDDGEPLHPAPDAPAVICPKCETLYAAGATRCGRDQVPLVPLTDLAYARQRICSECGRVAGDTTEFCGYDGARILTRWEIGLVARTTLPGELGVAPPAASPQKAEQRTTFPDRPTAKPKRPSTKPADSLPKVAAILPAVGGGPREPAIVSAPSDPASRSGAWFASGPVDPATRSGAGYLRDEEISLGPTQVSRKLVAFVGVSAALCAGAFLFSRWAVRQVEQPAKAAAQAAPSASTAALAAPTTTAPPQPPSPLTPPTTTAPTIPTPTPAAPASPSPPTAVAAAPTPAPTAPVTPPAAAEPTANGNNNDEPEPARRARPRPARREDDPSKALAEALRRAASGAHRPTTAPPTPRPAATASDEGDEPAPRKALSRAEAERYFLEAASLYKAGKASEALRRFRIISELGPRDGELQGRVLLNMGHISEGLGSCGAAKSYYTRARRLIGDSSPMRPSLEARIARVKEGCP